MKAAKLAEILLRTPDADVGMAVIDSECDNGSGLHFDHVEVEADWGGVVYLTVYTSIAAEIWPQDREGD